MVPSTLPPCTVRPPFKVIAIFNYVVSRNISFDNPSVLYNTRICYVVAQVIIIGCYYWTTLIVSSFFYTTHPLLI